MMRRGPAGIPAGAKGVAGALLLAAFAGPRSASAQVTADTAPLAAPAPPAAPAAPGGWEDPPPGPEATLHALLNRHRERIGCRQLGWHPASADVAEARSSDMLRRRYFDHRTPDGRTVFDEVADAGIEARGSIAENIALTQAGPRSVLEMWRESRPHRRNLENCAFTHHGLGERGGVWTQILLAQPTPGKPDGGLSGAVPASPRR